MNSIDIKHAPSRLGVFRLISYILPSIPLAALGMPIVVHLPQFYASKEIGLDVAISGAVFGIVRIFDFFVDPVMGYWSDRWQTPFGRRKPLILIGAPLLAIGIWMVFVPDGPVSAFHLGFWLFVMYLGWSMTTIPHMSWAAELSPDYHERSRIYGWSMFATLVGFIGVLIVPAVLEHFGASEAVQVMSMAIFAIGILVPAVALCVGFVPEPEVKLKTHAPLIPTLRFLLRDSAIRRVMAVDLIESFNQGARGVMFLYFMRLALAQPKWANTLLLVYFVSGIVCIPGWIALSKRIGKHRALIGCYVYGICMAPLLFLVPPGNVPVVATVLIFTGVSYAAPAFLLRAMMADIADADTAETGAERAGLMYSFLSMTSKLGIGISAAVALGILKLMGFDPKHVAPTPDAIAHMKVFYILLPMGLAMLSLSVMLGYSLDEARQRRLRAEIERRRAEHTSAEDIMPPGLLPGGAALASDSEAVTHLETGLPLNQRT